MQIFSSFIPHHSSFHPRPFPPNQPRHNLQLKTKRPYFPDTPQRITAVFNPINHAAVYHSTQNGRILLRHTTKNYGRLQFTIHYSPFTIQHGRFPSKPTTSHSTQHKTAVFPQHPTQNYGRSQITIHPFTNGRSQPNQSPHIRSLNTKRPYSPQHLTEITAVHNSTRPFPPKPIALHFITQNKTAVFSPTPHKHYGRS